MNVLVKFRRPLALTAAVVATAFAFAAQAQPRDAAWPSKPIRFVIPFAAGGSIDVVARLMGRHLEGRLGQNVVVENRPGAGGTVGADSVARAAADGHTFLFTAQGPLVLNPFLMKLPYDPLTDFQALGGTVTFAYALVTQTAEPSRTWAELVARTKSNPAGMSYGSSGVGTGGHLVAELFRQKTGARLNHIPYSGTAPTQRDAMAGHIGFMFDVIGSAVPLITSGKLKALAVTSKSRSRALPDTPAIAESVPGFEALGWLAFFAPKGLPPEIVQRLNAEIDKAYRTPDFVAFLEKSGYDYVPGPAEQLHQIVQRDAAMWRTVIREAGIKPDQ